MNSCQRRTANSWLIAIAIGAAAAVIGTAALLPRAALAAGKRKGVDVEIPYESKELKTPGLSAPYYFQESGRDMIVSNEDGGVFSVTMAGKTTELAGKSKLKHPAGVFV